MTQPDLFGEYDRLQALREVEAQPHACPRCGTVEPNAFLLRNNHGHNALVQVADRMCVAQRLTEVHIIGAVRRGDDLNPYLTRGRSLGLDVDAIVAAAEANR